MNAPGDERVDERADDLLPEERVTGSDDARAQAAAVLADSDERAAARDADAEGEEAGVGERADPVEAEHRRSEETVEPER